LPRHPDFVADHDVGQEREMRVAMRRVDRRAGLAGARRALDMTGTERQRLSAAAVQDDRRLAEARDFDPRLRPRIGPGLWLDRLAGRQGLRKRALEQDLREHGLGVDPQSLAAQHDAAHGKHCGDDERAWPPQRGRDHCLARE